MGAVRRLHWWSEEEKECLRRNYGTMPLSELTGTLNSRFGMTVTEHAVDWMISKLSLRPVRRRFKWPPEADRYIRDGYGTMTAAKMAAALSERYGHKLSSVSVHVRLRALGRKKPSNGITDEIREYARKGYRERTARAVKAEIMERFGVSVSENRIGTIWRRHVGVPAGVSAIEVDGRLETVPSPTLGKLKRQGLISGDPDVTRLMLAVCRLETAINRAKRGKRRPPDRREVAPSRTEGEGI